MVSHSISLQMSCNTTVPEQCPLLYGEVTKDIPEANIGHHVEEFLCLINGVRVHDSNM